MPTILILPVKSQGQIRTLIYGDFAKQDVPALSLDIFEVLAFAAGLVLENAQYRAQMLKALRR